MTFSIRLATQSDRAALTTLMETSINRMQRDFLTPAQIAASHAVMGLDEQLIADRTYYLVEQGDRLAGSGGWSRRATLYGGDHSIALRDARLLDPALEPARIRAMYTHPDFARQGVGRMILDNCEAAAVGEGFTRLELMATLAGEPLYSARGYRAIERLNSAPFDGVTVPLVRMTRDV
ncbi:MAG: GNAT family N-acetyltransferase [Sphingomonas bacterium]|nr:GNAT family N-acetyltransferase [Sphingomonas bacterium]